VIGPNLNQPQLEMCRHSDTTESAGVDRCTLATWSSLLMWKPRLKAVAFFLMFSLV